MNYLRSRMGRKEYVYHDSELELHEDIQNKTTDGSPMVFYAFASLQLATCFFKLVGFDDSGFCETFSIYIVRAVSHNFPGILSVTKANILPMMHPTHWLGISNASAVSGRDSPLPLSRFLRPSDLADLQVKWFPAHCWHGIGRIELFESSIQLLQ